MRLLVNTLNPKPKKNMCIVHIPKNAQRDAIVAAIEKARFLKIAAEHSDYVAQSIDIATIFEAQSMSSEAPT